MSRVSQPLSWSIAWRYLLAQRSSRFVSFISLVSVLGIAIGVMVLVVVLSVMNGFENTLRNRILGMVSHITLSQSHAILEDEDHWRSLLGAYPQITHVAPFVEQSAVLSRGEFSEAVFVKGIDPEIQGQTLPVFEAVVDGDMNGLNEGSNHIAIGKTLAKNLKVSVGDSLTLISLDQQGFAAETSPKLERFIVAAVFHVDMKLYDEGFAYIHIKDAQAVYDMGQSITALSVTLTDPYLAPNFASRLVQDLGLENPAIWVSDWTTQNSNFFLAIKTQKSVMFIILLLIVAVAAFNLVSMLVMVVTDKAAHIAILRTLGYSPGGVLRIFLVQGTLIGLVGTALGVIVGLIIAANIQHIVLWIEGLFDREFITAEVYLISELKAQVNYTDVMLICIAAIGLSLMATLYPAWRAAQTQPAEALRYE